MRCAFAFALLFWALPGSAEARCHVAAWRAIWGVETNGYMDTNGSLCRTSVSRVWNTSAVRSVSIASAPQNGTASASGRAVSYQARPGFKGADSFVFAILGEKAGGPQRATV